MLKDTRSEQALIAAVLFNNEWYYEHNIQRAFRPECMQEPHHAALVEQILTYLHADDTVRPELLQEWAAQHEDFRAHDGAFYLDYIADLHNWGEDRDAHALRVSSIAARQKVGEIGRALVERSESYIADRDADTFLVETERMFTEAMDTGLSESVWKTSDTTIAGTLKAYREQAGARAIKTGIFALDGHLKGLRPKTLNILAGRPSMGKSAIALNIALNVAKAGGVVADFQLEMGEEQCSWRMMSAVHLDRTGECIPYEDADAGVLTESQLSRLESGARLVPHIHQDFSANLTVDDIRARLRRLKRAEGRIDLVLIDYLQIMRVEVGRGKQYHTAIGDVTRQLKQIAKQFACPIVLLSQLSREVEKREDKTPLLSDLRESGNIEQDADTVLFAYREHYYERNKHGDDVAEHEAYLDDIEPFLDIIIAKNRMGRTGRVSTFWNAPSGLITGDMRLARTRAGEVHHE